MTKATNAPVLAICYAQGWCANENYMTATEAALVTSIGTAFSNKSTITHFEEFQYFTGVTALANQAFYNCDKLTSIVLPSSITTLPYRCFYDCDGFTSFTIPSTITSLPNSQVFYMTRKLVKIIYNSPATSSYNIGRLTANYLKEFASDVYTVVDGVIYNGTKMLGYPVLKTTAAFTCPSFMTEIGSYCMHDANNLTSVVVNEGCTALRGGDEGCIQTCTKLNTLDLPSTLTTIGGRCVYNLKLLNTLICRAMTAPATSGSYPVSQLGNSATGTKRLCIHQGATGYSSGVWQTLQNNGWVLTYIEDM